MGSKPKFWYRPDRTEVDWLFKYARENTGEHWAEKIAAEVAGLLDVTHPVVELATFDRSLGVVTKSFASDGSELVHGNQILARIMSDYDEGATFRQSRHTLANIWTALDRVFKMPEESERAKRCFAEYLILDALIGNTDRHHENWGLLRRRTDSGWSEYLAPSFDHASSLGRELQDSRRDLLLSESRVGNYVKRGRGGIYWSDAQPNAPSPLKLALLVIREYPALFHTAERCLQRANEGLLYEIVARIPNAWMSDSARRFALCMMQYSLSELREAL